jgi:hypothetical protein
MGRSYFRSCWSGCRPYSYRHGRGSTQRSPGDEGQSMGPCHATWRWRPPSGLGSVFSRVAGSAGHFRRGLAICRYGLPQDPDMPLPAGEHWDDGGMTLDLFLIFLFFNVFYFSCTCLDKCHGVQMWDP